MWVEFESQWELQEGVSGRKFAAKSPGNLMGECFAYVDLHRVLREGVGVLELGPWGSHQPGVWGKGSG